MRKCSICKEDRPLEDFYRDGRTRDGISTRCRACRYRDDGARLARGRERDRERYAANRQDRITKQSEYDKRRRMGPEGDDLRQKQAAYMRRWRAKNTAARKDTELRSRNGITLADYERIIADQDGRCGICRNPPQKGNYLCVDHSHSTGKVRGLLCRRCNLAVGNLDDDPERAAAAALYLEKHQ